MTLVVTILVPGHCVHGSHGQSHCHHWWQLLFWSSLLSSISSGPCIEDASCHCQHRWSWYIVTHGIIVGRIVSSDTEELWMSLSQDAKVIKWVDKVTANIFARMNTRDGLKCSNFRVELPLVGHRVRVNPVSCYSHEGSLCLIDQPKISCNGNPSSWFRLKFWWAGPNQI